MRIVHGPVDQTIDPTWWAEAGMSGFEPTGASYEAAAATRPVQLVAVGEVLPLIRNLSHGVFNDSHDSGTAKQRVVRLLRGFREGALIPPVELDRVGSNSFRLFHGAHRFYCSLVVGFTHVPAVVYDEEEWRRSR